jgi:hypothetical protein
MSTTTKGQIVWTNSATVGTYQLVITCTKAGLTNGTKNITLSITNPTPTPSSIQVYGTNSLLGINATAGSGNFQAIDNTGSDITSSGE